VLILILILTMRFTVTTLGLASIASAYAAVSS
jgi:hypothetical protein